MKRFCLGILAHVDAGKTTLTEAILYKAGALRKAGRVDHQDTLLDYDETEKERGITIYNKEAHFSWQDAEISLIDTPGHIDFSAEMERSLRILDAAILVIDASGPLSAHTQTIFSLLRRWQIPTLIFVNKMDLSYEDSDALMARLEKELSASCIDVAQSDWQEKAALANERLLESFLEKESLSPQEISESFASLHLLPAFFGSALKMQGVEAMMDFLAAYLPIKESQGPFGGLVYKAETDARGILWAHTKITSGTLQVRQKIDENSQVDQLRLFNGLQSRPIDQVQAGMVVAIKGLKDPVPGLGLGIQPSMQEQTLVPCLNYRLLLPEGADAARTFLLIKPLQQQDPTLKIDFDERRKQISMQLMGQVQMSILEKKIAAMTGHPVSFLDAEVAYKETIAAPVYGYGHFEPLRHYAEVHLLLEPLPASSGVKIDSKVPLDQLAYNWQQQIIKALEQYRKPGALTGSPLTDVRITLIAGKAHLKHTEAGDFRQAACRALRQALCKSENILLEPCYSFQIQLPAEDLSKVIYELDQRKARYQIQEGPQSLMKLEGSGPVRLFMNFQNELLALTRGRGQLIQIFKGYEPSQDQSALVEAAGYDFFADLRNPASSVFCTRGAGVSVEWDEVEEKLHIPLHSASSASYTRQTWNISEEKAQEVFARAGGRNEKKSEKNLPRRPKKTDLPEKVGIELKEAKPVCLIVDGYNMIFSWQQLKPLAKDHIDGAREQLNSLLINYAGYRNWKLMIVYDGYRVKDHTGSSTRRGTANIIYTRTGQSADQYIERAARELRREYRVIVASGDGLIQNSILSHGASRMSSRELESRVEHVNEQALAHLKGAGS